MRSDLAALSDGDLARRSAVGDDDAFAEVMRRHRRRVYRLILANVADPDEALDLVQETFVSAYGALRRFDPERPMSAWLARIALNKARDWARRRAVRRMLGLSIPVGEIAELHADDRPLPDAEAIDRTELARLSRAVAQLPASQREPLVLCVVEGLSQAEAAELLAISEKAVETRIRRARARLAQMLGR
ncbi:RNA polymerase subunit sigma-24 [Sphingomonas spermidinifaciens]|uniref:RNA polymerase sigma factor n=1 Tax=Sphingomonas spermidinifaciens TaxID=1141889 RepID=A0A2A4B4W4_9SPHN|nr:RNA polymerase sigma factor [Sphingomonas spermidinifaciens]PCD03481.1 RNA polymerase subunit sigma-24 [Sphingomonas spermidinifaciens]